MGPDLVSNLVIISFIPFAFYLFGNNILKTLYLFNAVVAIIVYWSAMHTNLLKQYIIENKSITRDGTEKVGAVVFVRPSQEVGNGGAAGGF